MSKVGAFNKEKALEAPSTGIKKLREGLLTALLAYLLTPSDPQRVDPQADAQLLGHLNIVTRCEFLNIYKGVDNNTTIDIQAYEYRWFMINIKASFSRNMKFVETSVSCLKLFVKIYWNY